MPKEKRRTVSRDEKRVPRANTVQALAEEMERKIAEEFRRELAKQNRKRSSAAKNNGVKTKSAAATRVSGKAGTSETGTKVVESVEKPASARASTTSGVPSAGIKTETEDVPTTTELAVIPAPASETHGRDRPDDDNSFGVTGALATNPIEMPRFNYPEELRNRSRNSLGMLLMQMLAESSSSSVPPARRSRHLRPIPINIERMSNQGPHLARPSDAARISMGRQSDRPFMDLVEFPFMPLLRRSPANRRRSLQQQLLLQQQQQQLLLQQQMLSQQEVGRQQQTPAHTADPPVLAAACDHGRTQWQARSIEDSEGSRSDESETLTDDYSALFDRDNEFVIIMEADDRDVLPFQSIEELMGLPRVSQDIGVPIMNSEVRSRRRRRGLRRELSDVSSLENRVLPISLPNGSMPPAENPPVADGAQVEGARTTGPDAAAALDSADPTIACIRQLLGQVIRMSREGSTSGSIEVSSGQRPSVANPPDPPPRISVPGRRMVRRRRPLVDSSPPNVPISGTRVLLRRPSRSGRGRRARGWRPRRQRRPEGDGERAPKQPSPGKQQQVQRPSQRPQQGENDEDLPENEQQPRQRHSKSNTGAPKRASGRGRGRP